MTWNTYSIKSILQNLWKPIHFNSFNGIDKLLQLLVAWQRNTWNTDFAWFATHFQAFDKLSPISNKPFSYHYFHNKFIISPIQQHSNSRIKNPKQLVVGNRRHLFFIFFQNVKLVWDHIPVVLYKVVHVYKQYF